MKTNLPRTLFLVCLCLTILIGCSGVPRFEDKHEPVIKPVRTTPAPISYGEWLRRNYPAPQDKNKNGENRTLVKSNGTP